MEDFILYGDPRSTYVRTVRMAAEEKGVDYQLQAVELRAQSYADLHPFRPPLVRRLPEPRIFARAGVLPGTTSVDEARGSQAKANIISTCLR